jgi:glutaredoxin
MKFKKYTILIFILFLLLSPLSLLAQSNLAQSNSSYTTVYFFGRDDCKFCQAEKEFLTKLQEERDDFEYIYYNIFESEKDRELFLRLTESKEIPKITPITVINNYLIQGFNSEETTGQNIIKQIELSKTQEPVSIEDFINNPEYEMTQSGSGCQADSLEPCILEDEYPTFDLPFIGVIKARDFSLFSLSAILGFVDGFNPCAMWVLVTFLLILLQVGDRRKMWQIAGLFILAEAIMYNLILNVWYSVWDFVGLDRIVTPLVGLLAVGSGVFFLWKYNKDKNKPLVCDVTDAESQSKFEGKIKKIASSPLTIASALGIIGLALSVNIIEFACSIGIPQAYTKILDLNTLDFLARQFYILIYTIAYMIDDLIVFGLALWGINKIHMSAKYSKISTLIGGILMLILGIILIVNPNILSF